ncbi:MAG: TolB family protein [Candidatus Rokuibacteriota bacterium]
MPAKLGLLSRVVRVVTLMSSAPVAVTLAATPPPLAGFPSCDYSSWSVVGEIPTGDRAHWSPDGQHFVAGRNIYDTEACPAGATEPCQPIGEIPWDRVLYRPTWSFDGEVIVFDAPAGPVEVPGEIYSVQSEGEGTQLFAWHRPSGVISQLTSREIHRSASFARFAHQSLTLTWITQGLETGTQFVPMIAELVVEGDGTAHLEDTEALVEAEGDPGYGAFNRIGEFSADDGGILLISTRSHSGDGEVWRIDLATREWANLTDAPTSWEEHPRSSPNGQKITFMSTRAYPGLANLGLAIGWFLGLPSSHDTVLILPYAVAGTALGFSGEQYLANPDGTEAASPTLGTELDIAHGWFSRGAEFSPDGRKLAIAQRPRASVTLPVLPPYLIQYNDRVTGRNPRTVILEFDCAEP